MAKSQGIFVRGSNYFAFESPILSSFLHSVAQQWYFVINTVTLKFLTVWDLGIYSPNDICVSLACRMVEYTPLSIIKSGIDFQTSVNRSEKQVCWWNCWQINYINARDINLSATVANSQIFLLMPWKRGELEISRQSLLLSATSLILVLLTWCLSLSFRIWVHYCEIQ